MKRKLILGLFLVAAACGQAKNDGKDEPQDPNGPSDPNGVVSDPNNQPVTYTGPEVRFLGRVQPQAGGQTRLSWAGTGATTRFEGTQITVSLQNVNVTDKNQFDMIIDNGAPALVKVEANKLDYTFSGLASGTHTATLVKRTEAAYGSAIFMGFKTDGKLLPTQTPTGRRIEFIGDSITNGYGNLGPNQTCVATADNENANQSFASLAAQALKADYTLVAWAGHGVYRNRDLSTTDLMPAVFNRAIATDASSTWDFSQFVPQVVVINLGTNDIAPRTPVMDAQAFATAYQALVKAVRAKYPDAQIICAMGPMLFGSQLPTMRQAINGVVQAVNSAGDSKVSFLEFPAQPTSPPEADGCEYHPNVSTHTSMASQLGEAIRQTMDWN